MIFNIMPSSVLGGAVITVFAMILINGIKMIAKAGFSDRNLIVLGVIFGLGLGLGRTLKQLQDCHHILVFYLKIQLPVCV